MSQSGDPHENLLFLTCGLMNMFVWRACLEKIFQNCHQVIMSLNLSTDSGWMTYDFLSFSTVFQSYQNHERLIIKGCMQ